MHRFVWRTGAAVAGSLWLATQALAQAPARADEWAIESNTEIVSIPESLPTTLGFKPCDTCAFMTLRMEADARLYVARQQVSLDVAQRYARRGSTGLTLFYDTKTRVVTRVVLHTELDAADAQNPGMIKRKSQ